MKNPNKTQKYTQQISSNAKKNGLGKHPTSDSQYQGFQAEMSVVQDNSAPVVMEGIRGKVFLDRYALRAKDGTQIETTPEEMWKRVAWGISQAEKPSVQKEWEQKFYDVMKGFKFVPGGRILSGAGTGYQVTYFNCFVIPSPKDSRDGIIDSLKQLVEIQSRSGGVGLNLSSLRPKGARVKKVNGFSSGPVTWAGLFSYATHDVVQQGGSRRGATMLMLHDWHPDIEEFVTVKQDLSKINGANLSVCISDAFMEAVKQDADWDLLYPDLDHARYDELWSGDMEEWKAAGGTVKVAKTVKAKYLWDLICEAAWRSAEPGLHFLERSNTRSNTWYFERLIATNPCGEQPLGPWAVCNLGAMNLSAYVQGDQFDFVSFGQDVKVAMRLMDNVIDQTYYFFPENEDCAKNIRRTGLGIMGLADALIKMKLRYGSEESEPVIRQIFQALRDSAYEASSDNAKEKGSFPMFDKEKYLQGYHIKQLPESIRAKIATQGIRNAVLLTIAPTGTTSLVSGVSSGVEPVYEFSFLRRWRGGEEIVYHPLFDEWRKDHPEDVRPDYFVSANDLTPMEHVAVQAIAQEYIDSSISKTVNAPNAHTVADVQSLYMSAYDMGLKGITYMRDGSRQGVLERVEPPSAKASEDKEKKVEPVVPAPVHRPMVLRGRTYKVTTPLGEGFITINRDEKDQPFEVFITVAKGGSHTMADAEALGRLISMTLRYSGDNRREIAQKIVQQLRGIGGSSHTGFGKDRVMSLPDAIAKVLSEDMSITEAEKPEQALLSLEEPQAETPLPHTNGLGTHQVELSGLALSETAEQLPMLILESSREAKSGDLCPECGNSTFVMEEGCQKCYSCGYSKC